MLTGGVVVLHACQVAVSSVGPIQNSLKQFCAKSHLFLACGKGFAFLRSHREHSCSASGFYTEGSSLVKTARVKLVYCLCSRTQVTVAAHPCCEEERGCVCFVLVRGWRNPQLFALTKQIVRFPLQSSDCLCVHVCLPGRCDYC